MWSGNRNAVHATHALTPAVQDKNLFPALLHIIKSEYLLQNAEHLVTNVNTIPIVP